jgi:hypothetical protein
MNGVVMVMNRGTNPTVHVQSCMNRSIDFMQCVSKCLRRIMRLRLQGGFVVFIRSLRLTDV